MPAPRMIDSMAGRIVSPELVGRAAEQELIRRALADAASGRARTVLVGGEAGVGKSRLLTESLAAHRAAGGRVLLGGCMSLADGALPFAPLVEALRPLVRAAERDTGGDGSNGASNGSSWLALDVDVVEALRVVATDLGLRPTAPAEPAAAAELRPEWARSRLYERVLDLLRRLGEDGPLVVAVEDLHWADDSTRELLAFLVRNVRSERLLIVITFRSDELHRRHPLLPWLAEMDRLAGVERIELPRLGHDDVVHQLAAILGTIPTTELVGAIFTRSDGNPFFVEELVAAGGLERRLPPTLREVLAARLAHVSDTTHRLLGVAAVAGRQIEHDLLVDVAGFGEPLLLDALREATTSQLLVADEDATGRYTFRHALLAEAAAEAVLPGERRRLHVAIAEWLERAPTASGAERAARLAEIAYHWTEAREIERAFQATLAAADAAFESRAYAESLRQFERAVDTWDVVADAGTKAGFGRVELLRRAARAAQLAGDPPRAAAFLREALSLVDPAIDPARAGLLTERLGRAYWSDGRIQDGLEAYARAVDLVPADPPSEDRARVLAGYAQALMLAGRYRESLPLAEAARSMAKLSGSRQLEGHATTTVATDLAYIDGPESAIELAREGLAISYDAMDIDDIGRGHANLASILHQAGRYEEAIEVSFRGSAELTRFGLGRTYGAFNKLNAADAYHQLGGWDEVERLCDEVEPFAVGVGRIFALQIRARLAIDAATDLLGTGIEAQFNGPLALTRLELASWEGETETGRRIADDAINLLAATEDIVILGKVIAAGITIEADAAERAGAGRDPEGEAEAGRRSAVLIARLEEIARAARGLGRMEQELATALLVGRAETTRVAGQPDESSWRDAAIAFDRLRTPYPAAGARWRAAEAVIAARGSRDEATSLLTTARAEAVKLDARPLIGAIDGLAARARLPAVSPVPSVTESGDGSAGPAPLGDALAGYDLTPREVEVLRLVAAGRTNRQIAEELFISESTAGVHVSHILGKLGAAGRVEAATIATRLGLGAS